ncbi:MAG: hypothetical protein QOD77_1660 [Thermoplasmata archaeon]|jgi:hypothetical protein|nr:hypothetical protein [Thermoplasmata archaeon]
MQKALLAIALAALLAATVPVQAEPDPMQPVCAFSMGGRYAPAFTPLPDSPGGVFPLLPVQEHDDTPYYGVKEFIGIPYAAVDMASPLGWQFQGLCEALEDIIACIYDPTKCLPEQHVWNEAHHIVYRAESLVRMTQPIGPPGQDLVRVLTVEAFMRERI